MARLHVEILDIAEDADRVSFACAIDVLDVTVLAEDSDGDDILHTVVLNPKSTSSSWQGRVAASVLAADGPLLGVVESQFLTGGGSAIAEAQVRVKGLPGTVPSWPSALLVAAPARIYNKTGGRTIGVCDYVAAKYLPDNTVIQLTVWCTERVNDPITVRLACAAAGTTADTNATQNIVWSYLDGMTLTLNSPTTVANYRKPYRLVVAKAINLDQFSSSDISSLRNAGAFWLYTTSGSPKDGVTVLNASVSFALPEGL